jgi:hypothetical protein
MTLAVVTYVPEGIVMASDSRQFLQLEGKTPGGKDFRVNVPASDSVTKTFLLEDQKIGISSFGEALLAGVPIASHIKKFIEEELTKVDDITTVPEKIVKYFRRSFPKADVGFHVAGYKKEEGKISVPYVYYCHVSRDIVERRNVKSDGSLVYGAMWSGEIDVIASIVNPVIVEDEKGVKNIVRSPAPIVWDAMTLQDAIDFSIYAIRTTIDTMRFQARPKTVGGPIDVLLITPDEVRWIQRKGLHGEERRET